MARLVMGLKLWRLCAGGGKRYTQALYLSAGFGDFGRLSCGVPRSGWARGIGKVLWGGL